MKSVKKFNRYKYYVSIVLLILAISLFFAFENSDKSNPGLGDEFNISIGENVSIRGSDLKVNVLKVSDSRCPLRVNCIIKGQASVTFNVLSNDVLLGKFVRSDKLGDTHLFLNGYNFYILGVDPYPTEAGTISKSDYVVRMVVTKQ